MNTPVVKISMLAFAASLLFGASAMAQTVSSNDYQAAKARIKVEYKAEKQTCASLASNAKDICVAQAKGKEDVAQAELDDSYKPTLKTHYKVRIAKAEATYAVAKQQCDDLAGNPKDVCIQEAKAAQTAAKADANVQMKTAKASSNTADLRSDASAEKREAQYKVEKEKCDAFAASAKDNCLTEAKAHFGKL